MKSEDRELCEALLSHGERVGTLSVFPVFRGGYLLLALPKDRSLAERVIGLYEPQRWKGRLFRGLLRVTCLTGIQCLMKRAFFELGTGGLLARLKVLGYDGEFGFLLGSADSQSRNLIGVTQSDERYYVVKVGRSDCDEVLRGEYALTKKFGDVLAEVPSVVCEVEFDGGYGYVSELVDGRSPRAQDDAKILGVLWEWLERGSSGLLKDLAVWSEMMEIFEEGSEVFIRLSALGQREVLRPVMHGDFTPWNVKICDGGDVKVLDWEYGVIEGVPGWDAIHYRVQRLMLVDGMKDRAVYEDILEWMSGDWMKAYLAKAGLAGSEEDLFGAYCCYSSRVLKYPREGLVQIWEQKRA